jgi:cytochrome c oxidase subunit IV
MDERAHPDVLSAHGHADVDRQVRAAVLVFVSLLVLTGFTVTAWTLHLPTRLAIALALAIAAVKGSLVAGWFMHLVSEKRLVYWVLGLTAVLFLPLLLFPALTSSSALHR